jgi:hypothetical protein
MLQKECYLFSVEPKKQTNFSSSMFASMNGHRLYSAPNEASGLVVYYYLKNDTAEKVSILFSGPEGKEIKRFSGQSKAGIHQVIWNLRGRYTRDSSRFQRDTTIARPRNTVPPGDYLVTLEVGEAKQTQKAVIR